jgi:geranylgeranyl diphosphate synthase type II
MGKGFRPALCIASSRAQGAASQDVLRTAAVLELYHNAFLVHDDVEDGSHLRRGQPTLHAQYGVPVAVKCPATRSSRYVFSRYWRTRNRWPRQGSGSARNCARMAKESAEGQALELDWSGTVPGANTIARTAGCRSRKPAGTRLLLRCGLVELSRCFAATFVSFAALWSLIGVAFQIQDDILNLMADQQLYGKEIAGDLWEGKHTVMLLHMMRSAPPAGRIEVQRILRLPRERKTAKEVAFLWIWCRTCGSVQYASNLARRLRKRR